MSRGKLKQRQRRTNQDIRWAKRPVRVARELPDETPIMTAMALALLINKIQKGKP